jgi:hypothetical protein
LRGSSADPAHDRTQRLRGSLAAEEPGARGLERVARNPGCERLRSLTIANIKPATAVEKVYGEVPEEGQSPFALSAGNLFEELLYENGAQRLLELYRRQGRLGPSDTKVVIVPDHAPGTRAEDMARREALTRRILRMKLGGDRRAPNVVVKPRLAVRLVGEDHFIEPDAIVAADDDPFYRPVEIKSYADRRGKTEQSDLRSGLRQAAVAAVALRQFRERLGAGHLDGRVERFVPAICDLVLKRPGSFGATLNANTIEGEVASIERAIDESPRNLAELEALLEAIGPGASLDDPEVLNAVPHRYEPGCKEHCAMHRICKAQAMREGDPVVLGERAQEELAPAGSLGRVYELLGGAEPRTPEEAELQRRLIEADEVLEGEVGYGG